MKIQFFLIASAILITSSGCTTVQIHSYANAPVVNDTYKSGQKASFDNVQVLYSEPRANYESIGVFSVKK